MLLGLIGALLIGLIGGGVIVAAILSSRWTKATALQRQLDAKQSRLKEAEDSIKRRDAELRQFEAMYKAHQAEVISYSELKNENLILKRDLRNIVLVQRKTQLDSEAISKRQTEIDERSQTLARRYLTETVKWISSSITPNNYVTLKQRLLDCVARVREIGYSVTQHEESDLLADLKAEYEKAVRAAFEREEQNRIKAQIREETLRQREVDRELAQLDRERLAIKAALDKALAEAKDIHSAEVQQLQQRLAEAEEKSRRAIAQAQLTKAGHVYVISNIGSFGRGVFKVGMTRRLEPKERVRELCSGSVPFPFDIHMMISSKDAPALETALHRRLYKMRINRVNPRKEFFKIDIDSIRKLVEEHHGEVTYTADAEALEYNQSLAATDEDVEEIDDIFQNLPAADEEE